MRQELQNVNQSEAIEAYQAAIADKERKKQVWESFPNHKLDDRKIWADSDDAKHPLLGTRTFHPGQAAWTPMAVLFTMVKNYVKLNVNPTKLLKSQFQLFQWSPDGAYYATLVCLLLDEPIQELEDVISTDAEQSYIYSKFVLKGAFEAAEDTFSNDEYYLEKYQSFLSSGVICEA